MSKPSFCMFFPLICSVSGIAFAADPVAPTPEANTSPLKTTWKGNVKGRTTLIDTTRADVPDFNIDDFNLGVEASRGIGNTKFKINVNQSGTITVKEAHSFVEHMGFNLGFGRFDTGVYDANRAVDDTRRLDAVRAGYKLELGTASQSIAINAYYGRTFEGSANYADLTKATQMRAFGIATEAKFDGIFLKGYYGSEPNRLAAVIIPPATGSSSAGTTELSVAPWSSFKISGGYDADVYAATVTYVASSLGKSKKIELDGNKQRKYKTVGEATGEQSDYSILAVDLAGNSGLWGMTGVIKPEDKFIYGAAFVNSTVKVGSNKNSNNKLGVRGGYSTGSLTTLLEYETHFADKEIWTKIDSTPSKTRSFMALSMNMDF